MRVQLIARGTLLLFLAYPGVALAQGTLFVENDKVGVGVATPESTLHVRKTDGTAELLVQEQSSVESARTLANLQNNGVTFFRVTDTSPDGSSWTFQAEGPSFRFNKGGTGGAEVTLRNRNDGTNGLATLSVNGSIQADNVTFTSSRTAKRQFEPVDPQRVLDKITSLEISEWIFKDELHGRRHIGPMAEEFAAAFDLGGISSEISLIDSNGVAFAAIQGLHELVEKKDAQIQALQEQNTELSERLAVIEATLQKLTGD